MDYVSASVIGMALAMDAMAVSITCGMNGKNKSSEFLTAFLFGFFQMLMPVLGWSIGKVGSDIITAFDNITVFAILLFLGIKMLIDSKRQDYSVDFSFKNLIILAVATSIDALASGITLPVSVRANTPLYMLETVLIIGTITFILSLLGYIIGNRFRKARPVYAGMTGGIMLILIGIKTLFC